MELILQIVRDPAYTVSKQMLRVFGEHGGTIGRSLDSYWVIPDPKSYVSATHCVIEHDGAGFWLRDLSRNGVVFNGSRERIDPKKPVLIRNGDRIQFGLYEVVAHIRDRDPSRIDHAPPLDRRPATICRSGRSGRSGSARGHRRPRFRCCTPTREPVDRSSRVRSAPGNPRGRFPGGRDNG